MKAEYLPYRVSMTTPQGMAIWQRGFNQWKNAINANDDALVQYVQVTSIDSPALSGYSGVNYGNMLVAYDANYFTVYVWKTSGAANSPYVVTGDGGYWEAVAGRYINTVSRVNSLTALRLMASDANKGLSSTDLIDWIDGVLARMVVITDGAGGVILDVDETGLDHNIMLNLTAGDVHTQYLYLLGRAGGQVVYGGIAAGENLTIRSTYHATKGLVKLGTASAYDEANDRLGIGTLTPLEKVAINGNCNLPKTAGNGIKIDIASPSFGFRDILGEVKILSPGANDPTLAVFRDSLRQFSFSNAVMNEAFFTFHIPHDYVPSSDIYLHFHWAQNVVDTGGPAGVPGDVKWQAEVSYAKGHDQAAFPASFVTSLTATASATQYQHMISELQLSAASPSATQIDSDILEPDGVILMRVFRDPTDAADTLDQVPFLHYSDIHYQSTNIATKAKAPDFYT